MSFFAFENIEILINNVDPPLMKMDLRTRVIFKQIIDAYLETGEPIGSKTVSQMLGKFSPASIRNVMSELEQAGLLYAPHTSAGRMPTTTGLRFFVDGLMQLGELKETEKAQILTKCQRDGAGLNQILGEITQELAGLSSCAGIVSAPTTESYFRHIEFVPLAPGRILAVLVTSEGIVENRLVFVSKDVTPDMLKQASNYINDRGAGQSFDQMAQTITQDMQDQKTQLDALSEKVVKAGLAVYAGGKGGELIVKGQANLLSDITALDDLERIRQIFDALETKQAVLNMLNSISNASGVHIFIGSENALFRHTDCSVIIAPYKDRDKKIIGAIGVIGPTRVNYARIIPMVDFTAKMIEYHLCHE